MTINNIHIILQQIKIDDVSNYLIWLDLSLAIIYIFYTIMMVRAYIQKRKKVTIYMIYYFLSFASLTLVYFFGHDPFMISGEHTTISDSVAGVGLSITVLSMVFLFIFYCYLNSENQKYTIRGSTLGFALALWIILPFDEIYNLKMFSYTFMLIYAMWVYIKVIQLFLKMKELTNDKDSRRGISDIILGSFLFLLFMGFMTISGITNNGILYIISFIVECSGVTFMYLGFIHPMIRLERQKAILADNSTQTVTSDEKSGITIESEQSLNTTNNVDG